MLPRTLAVALLFTCMIFAGCCRCDSVGRTPPAFKFCNIGRIVDEAGWFYADVQDTFFGVDYYKDMHDQFDSGPY